MRKYIDYIKKTVLWLNELANKEDLPVLWVYWDYFLAVLKHRCLIRQYVIGEFWKLSNAARKRALTYSRIVSLFDKYNNPDYIHILNNKSDFNAYFSRYIRRDWLYVRDASLDDFKLFLSNHRTFIIKQIDGVEGTGVRKFTINDETNVEHLYSELSQENVLIEELIIQHPQMIFNNTSVNTIRTHTVLDKYGKAHVVKAILRAGVGDSIVDNYAQGGSIYEVDVESGIIITQGQSKGNMKSYIHPGTDAIMLGYKIPNWENVIDTSTLAAEELPQIGIIGWDVAIVNDGVELIEGNHNPDYELFEFLGSNGYYKKIKVLL